MSQTESARNANEPFAAISQATMAFNHTGSWRYLRPLSIEKLAPCRKNCPAGTDIPRVLALLGEDKLEEAYRLICLTNPLPAVCGRVCYHPCETACSRSVLDEGLAIQALERLVGEKGLELPVERPTVLRSEKVAVVGAGPAGLSCATFLARNGIQVHVFDSETRPGGMLRVGIPPYRLPRGILDREIARIERMGVEFTQRCRVGVDMNFDSLRSDFNAVFVAAGAHRSKKVPIPAEGPSVFAGLEFLRAVNLGSPPPIGRQMIVIGGGNTALDAARTARRLGCEPVIFYRRTRNEMPAHAAEIEEAVREGIEIVYLTAPVAVNRTSHRLLAEFVKMELGPPDASGRSSPVPIQGSNFRVETDSVVFAAGEEPDLGFVASAANVFLGGDAATGPSTVVEAIASGRKAAESILSFLGIPLIAQVMPALPSVEFSPESFNRDYFSILPRIRPEMLPLRTRTTTFGEVITTISRLAASVEARRCASCGVCNQCDNCWSFCPDAAIRRVEGRYEVDLTYCKGCGICAEECPRGVIMLAQEEL